jgi:lipoate-protein ligase B
VRSERQPYNVSNPMARQCIVVDLGLMDFREARSKQKEAADSPDRAELDVLYLVEHPPVITIGRSGDRKNVLVADEELRSYGVELIDTDRGGDVTYHGPGQLVAYPILNLNEHRRDVGWYLRSLEEVILRTLRDIGIQGRRIKGYTGVWVEDKKIAAIGIGIRRWITFHGVALNIDPRLDHFALITPCGIQDKGVTGVRSVLGHGVAKERLIEHFLHRFGEVFKVDVVRLDDLSEP